MRSQPALVGLVVLNLACLGYQFARAGPAAAAPEPAAPVLRGRALELVDAQGRVRAELKVLPAEPDLKMPDGTTGYPETVILRLITSKGRPNVKLAATEDGAGLVVGGESGYVQFLSRGKDDPVVKLVAKDGRQQVIKPAP